MQVGNSFRSLNFIEASTPSELRSLCLKNNLERGMEFQYLNVVFDGKKWYAFYKDDLEQAAKDYAFTKLDR